MISFVLLAKPILVPAGKTADIPFTIRVPVDAEPGGHYAGVLVGTVPLQNEGGTGEMGVGSLLSSLFLVRTTGAIIESGFIRDFAPVKKLVEGQEAIFALHFENTGNVHLRPEGEISITNMFGRTRGKIIIDKNNTFGNVLPNSKRKFIFEWTGEHNFFDIGRYKAVARLAYGENLEKTAYYTTYFWVIPWIPFFSITGFLFFFFWFGCRLAQRYILEALLLKKNLGANAKDIHVSIKSKTKAAKINEDTTKEQHQSTPQLSWGIYAVFIFSTLVLISCCVFTLTYFFQVLEDERGYQMVIKREGGTDIIVPH